MSPTAYATAATSAVETSVSFTAVDFGQIAKFLRWATGIHLTEANERMVYSRLVHRVRQLGMSDFAPYVARVLDPASQDERDFLICALTTNTTHFFREQYHFEFLKAEVLPRLIARARAGDRIRLWSSACSSGEETFSIALSLIEAFPEAPRYDIKILGSDIDRRVLQIAESATYSAATLRALPESLLDLGFEAGPDTSQWVVKPAIRAMVSFRHLNLIDAWPFRGRFDVIFCRNVAIYMEQQTQEQIWRGFGAVLQPGGHLFIGHSERLPASMAQQFTLVGKTVYRMTGAKPPSQ